MQLMLVGMICTLLILITDKFASNKPPHHQSVQKHCSHKKTNKLRLAFEIPSMQLPESISNPIKSRPPTLKTTWTNLSGTSVFPQGSFHLDKRFKYFFSMLTHFIYALFWHYRDQMGFLTTLIIHMHNTIRKNNTQN